mmetsp:Transcript_13808/g.22999  ORF Transcript_13808/g.22999 Transcript_13808/m.22999 type:complete len:472 (+) Transcript_13808:61-1476(+)
MNESYAAPFSANAQALLDSAKQLAISKGHLQIATEHLAYAMCHSDNRAVLWVASQTHPGKSEALSLLRSGIKEYLDNRPLFQTNDAKPGAADVTFSPTMTRVLSIARQIGSGSIRDGNLVLENGLIASEFLLAGMLVEGTGVGADAFTRNSAGRVNSQLLLRAIQVDPTDLMHPNTSEENWNAFEVSVLNSLLQERVVGGSMTTSQNGASPWFPSVTLETLMSNSKASNASIVAGIDILNATAGTCCAETVNLPPAPTASSNWLIPGKLIIGEHPKANDMPALLEAGIDTFVSLIGEYSTEVFKNEKYPQQLQQQVGSDTDGARRRSTCTSAAGTMRSADNVSAAERSTGTTEPWKPPQLHFVHFPIRNFCVVSPDSLKAFVDELKRRIFEGHTIMVHCRGGHGRTSMIVIPLLCAIYDISCADAQQYVVWNTGIYRSTDRPYRSYLEMPETADQQQTIQLVEQFVRKRRR